MRDLHLKEKSLVILCQTAVVAGLLSFLTALYLTSEWLWLLVLSVLFAIVLRLPVKWLSRRTGWPQGAAFALVCTVFFTITFVIAVLSVPKIAEQGRAVLDVLPHSPAALNEVMRKYGLHRFFPLEPQETYDRVIQTISSLIATQRVLFAPVWIVTALVFTVLTGIYFAAVPSLYTHGLLRLLPVNGRWRGRRLLDQLAETLRWWMIGRLISMISVGVATVALLEAFQVPLSLVLGLVAGLFTFVPYVGPIASAFPILLITAVEAPEAVLWVLTLYTLIQSLEGYVLTPLVQRATVFLPPAVTLIAEAVMGTLFGVMGIVVATPVAAILLVVVRELYIRRLGERPTVQRAA